MYNAYSRTRWEFFYVFVTKPQCSKPTYVVPGTNYNNHLYNVTEDGRKPVPVLVYQLYQNNVITDEI